MYLIICLEKSLKTLDGGCLTTPGHQCTTFGFVQAPKLGDVSNLKIIAYVIPTYICVLLIS